MKRRRRRKIRSVPGFSEAVGAACFLAVVIWPWSAWPAPGRPQWLYLGCVVVLAAASAVRYARYRRSAAGRDKRELAAAAAVREHGTWLDREAGQSFSVSRIWWLRGWQVTRIPEEAVLSAREDDGEVPLLTEAYSIFPLAGSVIRHDMTLLADMTAGTARPLPAGSGPLREMWRLHKAGKDGYGLAAVSPAEVALLLAQLRASERISNDGAEEEPW